MESHAVNHAMNLFNGQLFKAQETFPAGYFAFAVPQGNFFLNENWIYGWQNSIHFRFPYPRKVVVGHREVNGEWATANHP